MIETLINSIPFFEDWVKESLIDSIKIIPFLFLVFLFIEIFEHFWANKIQSFLEGSKTKGPILGAIAASIPQCGFSVIASSLYVKKFITKGSVIAAYLATSDEAIPVLFMYPEYSKYVVLLIVLKLIIAIPLGYLVDLLFIPKLRDCTVEEKIEQERFSVEGCCSHEITPSFKKTNLLIHPLKHTLSVFIFILFTSLLISYLIGTFGVVQVLEGELSFLAPLISSVIGLIPNCAISVGLVILFTKGAISFGTLLAGLLSGAGVGLLVLIKNNKDKKDTMLILSILVVIGFVSGYFVQTFFG